MDSEEAKHQTGDPLGGGYQNEKLVTIHALTDWIENTSKLILVVVAVLYSLGLIVTNSYLLSFGITEFGLLRPRFVLTGALSVLPLAVGLFSCYLACFVTAMFLEIVFKGPSTYLIRLIIFYVISLVFSVLMFFYPVFFWSLGGSQSLWVAVAMGIIGVYPYFIIGFSEVFEPMILSRISNGDDLQPNVVLPKWHQLIRQMGKLNSGVIGFGGFVIICLYMGVMVRGIFPSVPQQFGGGEPRTVVLVLDQDANPGSFEIQNLLEPVELIWQTEAGYVVRQDDGSVVLVNDRIVNGVILTLPSGDQLDASPSGPEDEVATPAD